MSLSSGKALVVEWCWAENPGVLSSILRTSSCQTHWRHGSLSRAVKRKSDTSFCVPGFYILVGIKKDLKFIRLIAPPVVLHFSEFGLRCAGNVLMCLHYARTWIF